MAKNAHITQSEMEEIFKQTIPGEVGKPALYNRKGELRPIVLLPSVEYAAADVVTGEIYYPIWDPENISIFNADYLSTEVLTAFNRDGTELFRNALKKLSRYQPQ